MGSDCENGLPVQFIQVEVDTAQVQVGDTLVAQSAFFGDVRVPIDKQTQQFYRFKFATAPGQFVSFGVTLLRNNQGISIFFLSQIYAQDCSVFTLDENSLNARRLGNYLDVTWSGELEGSHYEVYFNGELEAITQDMGYSSSSPDVDFVEVREVDFDGNTISSAFAEVKIATRQNYLYRITTHGLMSANYLRANNMYVVLRPDGNTRKIYVLQ